MTDYERGYEQGKADATSKMHPEIRKCLEDYFDECFTEYKADRKPWVGLTDEEIESYWDWEDFQTGAGRLTILEMVRDIEAKLKEKNNG